jgi:hypothetical protein
MKEEVTTADELMKALQLLAALKVAGHERGSLGATVWAEAIHAAQVTVEELVQAYIKARG